MWHSSAHPSIICLFERVNGLKARDCNADPRANNSLPVVTWHQPTEMPTLVPMYLFYSGLCCAHCLCYVYTTHLLYTEWLYCRLWSESSDYKLGHLDIENLPRTHSLTHALTDPTSRAPGCASTAGAKTNAPWEKNRQTSLCIIYIICHYFYPIYWLQ